MEITDEDSYHTALVKYETIKFTATRKEKLDLARSIAAYEELTSNLPEVTEEEMETIRKKEFNFEPLEIPKSTVPSKEEIGDAAMKWLINANLGYNPSVKTQWIACYEWLLENGHIKQ